MQLPITDATAQDSWLTALGGAVIGFLSNFLIEWYKKRSKKEVETDVTEQLSDAADKNVMTTQKVIAILEERLIKDREYYEGLIARGKSECELQIVKMKVEYDNLIGDLQAQIIKGNNEKETLSKQVGELTVDKNKLQKEVSDLTIYKNKLQAEVHGLKKRLLKYEKRVTGPLPPLDGS